MTVAGRNSFHYRTPRSRSSTSITSMQAMLALILAQAVIALFDRRLPVVQAGCVETIRCSNSGTNVCCSIENMYPACDGYCYSCAAGKYDFAWHAICRDCGAGQYSYSGGSCTSCPAGQYQPTGGQSSCLSCPAGQYQPSTGQTSCIGCAAGKLS
jgi:hypothetical protein